MKKIAIIGAGISGLIIGQELRDFADILIFDKSRGVGGRMATRQEGLFQFDHGAQFFTAKTRGFKDFLQPLIDEGVVRRWDARFIEMENRHINHNHQWNSDYPHYVGTPKMNSLAKYLQKNLNVCLNTLVVDIVKNDGWDIIGVQGALLAHVDWVISTVPAAQALCILPKYFHHYPILLRTKMLSCFSLMLGFHEDLDLTWDAALVCGADISWISVNNSKPNRPNSCSILIHSTNDWSEQHLEEDDYTIKNYLLEQFTKSLRQTYLPDLIKLHKWRYANISKQPAGIPLIDYENQLAACGDWCLQGRVEAAFINSTSLARKFKDILK